MVARATLFSPATSTALRSSSCFVVSGMWLISAEKIRLAFTCLAPGCLWFGWRQQTGQTTWTGRTSKNATRTGALVAFEAVCTTLPDS